MREWVHDHSLSIFFAAISVAMLVCREITAWYEWNDTSGFWREQVVILGEGPWEMIQVLALVLATKGLRERGSAESKE